MTASDAASRKRGIAKLQGCTASPPPLRDKATMTKQKKKSKQKKRENNGDADALAKQIQQTTLDEARRRREAERSRELSRELCASRHDGVEWCEYEGEVNLPEVMRLVDDDLSEPYFRSFTYRYFVKNWPSLCLLAKIEGETVACVVSKAEVENSQLVAGENLL